MTNPCIPPWDCWGVDGERSGGCKPPNGHLEHSVMVLQSGGAMHDLWQQVWGCPTHVVPPDPPGMRPTAPLSITSVGETYSVTAVAGGQLILECPEDAVPPPHIEWHWEGSPLRVRVMGPGTVRRRGLGCTFTSPVILVGGGDAGRAADGGYLGVLGGCPQAGPGRGALPADPGRGGGGWRGVQLQGHQCAGGHQPARPGGGSR